MSYNITNTVDAPAKSHFWIGKKNPNRSFQSVCLLPFWYRNMETLDNLSKERVYTQNTICYSRSFDISRYILITWKIKTQA